jgi:N utilization substance protein B
MIGKHKSRELAMQVLFLWDSQGQADAELAERVLVDGTDDPAIRQRASTMAHGAWEMRQTSDQWMERLAPHWPPRRQPGVDRGILRLAIWELTSLDTPPKVVLDEAIELAKSFSTEQSPSFINGVMDAILREKNELTATSNSPTPAAGETAENS